MTKNNRVEDRGLADELLATFCEKEAALEGLMEAVCAKYDVVYREEGDNLSDSQVAACYHDRQATLNAEAADAAAQLIKLIEAGGPLPSAWNAVRHA